MFVHAVTVCKISREFGVSTPSIPQWWFYSFFFNFVILRSSFPNKATVYPLFSNTTEAGWIKWQKKKKR